MAMWICSFIVQKAQALISSSLKRRHFKNWIEIVRNEAPRLQHASTKTRDMETPSSFFPQHGNKIWLDGGMSLSKKICELQMTNDSRNL